MGMRQRERQGTTGERGASATDPDRDAIEQALGAAWLNAALDSTLGFVAVHDVDGTVRYVSPNVTAVLGRVPEDLTGPMPTHLVHPDDRDTVIETMTRVLESPRRVETLSFRVAHADGSWRWLETQVVNLVDHAGVRGVVTSSWDVTGRGEEREHAEAARRSGEERFRALAEHSTDILAVYDAAGNLNYRTNNALLQTFNVNSLNELTTATRAGTMTVAGTTTSPATNVTVNTSNAFLYLDSTFVSSNPKCAKYFNPCVALCAQKRLHCDWGSQQNRGDATPPAAPKLNTEWNQPQQWWQRHPLRW